MHWSVWFAKKYRAVTCFIISTLLFVGLFIGRYVGETIWQEELSTTKAQLQKSIMQEKRKKQELAIWQKKKAQLQKYLVYINSEKLNDMKSILKHWQTTSVQRKVRFNIEKMVSPSSWHHTMSRNVYRCSLRFWVQNEEDLLQAWQEKKRLPCLGITENITISRAEEEGVWVEEQLVCVQF